jgi:hypothetical protein
MDISIAVNKPGEADWNDLSWQHFDDGLRFIRSDITPSPAIQSDGNEKWGASSADMAAILLQRPVMVAIHATEMLNRNIETELLVAKPLTLQSYLSGISPKLLDI